MRDVPYVIDIRDDVERARENTSEDIGDDLDAVLERLDGYSERTHEDRDGLLDVVENELLQLEEQTDGEASKYLRSARNRVHVFRDARSESVDDVFVLESKVRRVDAAGDPDADVGTEDIRGEEAEFRFTLVNEGTEPRRVGLELAFYGPDGEELASHTSETDTVDGEEQRTVTMPAEVPGRTDYYAAQVVNTEEESSP